MAKIQIRYGSDGDGNASEYHLVRNHLIDPNRNIDKVIQYAEQRYLMTFLTAGVTSGRYTVPGYINMKGDSSKDTATTRIPKVPEKELIDGMAWKYRIMGRIQRAVQILGTGAVGTVVAATTTQPGEFKLRIIDDYLTPGMMPTFANGKSARVMGRPSGTPGNFIYTFQTYPGDTFSWATWVAVQTGQKTCFGGYSTYAERSLRGYGKVHYPDMYINHMTTQRKSIAISGDANTNQVIWYELNGTKGWTYEAEAQMRAQFALEDEHQKWWGRSNMKDANGNLLSTAPHFDEETGEPITMGDGYIEQIKGANDMETSGSSGLAVYDDFADMLTMLKKKSNQYTGKRFYCITGPDGMKNADDVIATRATQLNMTWQVQNSSAVGGEGPAVGFNFRTLNIAGDQVVFVENPLMGDEQRFPLRKSDGNLVMSSTFYFMDQTPDNTGRPNVEIRARGRVGINRNYVFLMENGMTGQGKADNPIDAQAFHVLKQNMLTVYNTKSCGIMTPPANS